MASEVIPRPHQSNVGTWIVVHRRANGVERLLDEFKSRRAAVEFADGVRDGRLRGRFPRVPR